jgi:hypothetical protein
MYFANELASGHELPNAQETMSGRLTDLEGLVPHGLLAYLY